MSKLPLICLTAAALAVSACSSVSERDMFAEGDRLEEASRGKKVVRSFEQFIASPNYSMSRDMWRGAAIEQYNPSASYVEIMLETQRGRLYINGQVAMDFPVCSGRFGGSETPRGTFHITQKAKDYRSSLYGNFVDAQDNIVQKNAEARNRAPKGAHFRGASMPYWMRFNGAVGMHVGAVYREGRSHGCVRIPEEACSILFEKLAVGSKVIVK